MNYNSVYVSLFDGEKGYVYNAYAARCEFSFEHEVQVLAVTSRGFVVTSHYQRELSIIFVEKGQEVSRHTFNDQMIKVTNIYGFDNSSLSVPNTVSLVVTTSDTMTVIDKKGKVAYVGNPNVDYEYKDLIPISKSLMGNYIIVQAN